MNIIIKFESVDWLIKEEEYKKHIKHKKWEAEPLIKKDEFRLWINVEINKWGKNLFKILATHYFHSIYY